MTATFRIADGHYARPDLFKLEFHAAPYQQAEAPLAPLQAMESLPAGELQRIADRHEVTPAAMAESLGG